MTTSQLALPKKIAAVCAAIFTLVALIGISAADAQDEQSDEVVIFVLDLSGSMNEPFDNSLTKLDVAKAAFVEAFANVSPDAQVGLRTYGDQIEPTAPAGRETSCTTDTRLVAPPAPSQQERLIEQVEGFSALGDTPVALALEQASADIPAGATGTIVLFSDGRDECFDADLDGDAASGPSFGEEPCAVAQRLGENTSVTQVATVGFRADAAAETELRCIAEATGGTYTAIETPSDAREALPQLLVELAAPRQAERLQGRPIVGASAIDQDPPSFDRLDATGEDQILYSDSIDINTVKVYRFDDYGPEPGTLTATVFGLPAEPDITFDVSVFVPRLDRSFFEGKHADTDAGLPFRQTASIRCTECQISGGPYDVLWVLSLTSTNPEDTGSYEIEILTEGEGFGGESSSCTAPQECFYPQAIEDLTAQLDQARDLLAGGTDGAASQALIDERDQLRESTMADQDRIALAEARTAELDERIANAPVQGTSWRLPMLLIALGALLAFAPLEKLRRSGADEPEDVAVPAEVSDPAAPEPIAASTVPEGERTGPSLDVGPAPAVSPNRVSDGNSWDAELEAAKAALAGQLPERPNAAETLGSPPPIPTATPDLGAPAGNSNLAQAMADRQPQPGGDQHVAPPSEPIAMAASNPIAAPADPAAQQAAAQQAAAQQAAAQQAAAQQAAAQQAAAEQAAAQQAAAEQAAAQQAAAEQAATQQAAAAGATQAAGWYPDPAQADQYRWWDGQAWTEHTSKPGDQGPSA